MVSFSFRNKIKTFQKRHGLINLSDSSSEEKARTLSSDSLLKHVRTLEKKGFICNEIRTVNNEAYNYGRLARITRVDTAVS